MIQVLDNQIVGNKLLWKKNYVETNNNSFLLFFEQALAGSNEVAKSLPNFLNSELLIQNNKEKTSDNFTSEGYGLLLDGATKKNAGLDAAGKLIPQEGALFNEHLKVPEVDNMDEVSEVDNMDEVSEADIDLVFNQFYKPESNFIAISSDIEARDGKGNIPTPIGRELPKKVIQNELTSKPSAGITDSPEGINAKFYVAPDRMLYQDNTMQEISQDVAQNLNQDVKQDVKTEINQEVKQLISQDKKPKIELDIKPDIKPDIRRDLKQNLSQDLGQEITQKMKQDIRQDMGQDFKQDTRRGFRLDSFERVAVLKEEHNFAFTNKKQESIPLVNKQFDKNIILNIESNEVLKARTEVMPQRLFNRSNHASSNFAELKTEKKTGSLMSFQNNDFGPTNTNSSNSEHNSTPRNVDELFVPKVKPEIFEANLEVSKLKEVSKQEFKTQVDEGNQVTVFKIESNVFEKNPTTVSLNQKAMPNHHFLQNHVNNQIIKSFSLLKRQDVNEIYVKLKPEFLGNVSINLTIQNGEMVGKIAVAKKEVKEMIEAQINSFKSSLAQLNVKVDQITVVHDATSRDNGQQSQGQSFQGHNNHDSKGNPSPLNYEPLGKTLEPEDSGQSQINSSVCQRGVDLLV